jgi:N6-L-threonylcarbamoyladenine synthase
MIILGIDTSCDDTSFAVLGNETILSNVVSSQVALHSPFGGVVPEIASRKHVERIDHIYRQALHEAGLTLRDIEILSVTQGPGLIGSILVGLCFAKGLALATGKPLIGVNHVEAHGLSIFLEETVEFPFLSLIVSGGHTILLFFSDSTNFRMVGTTRDDAVGEAFDKIAKYLHLGYPGGQVIEEIAMTGNPESVVFPRPMLEEDNYDFSFSGLKTAFINYVKKNGITDGNRSDILASFQQAACDVLALKTVKAARDLSVQRVVLGGGVASNKRLREVMAAKCADEGISMYVPRPGFCTDNGAMIACAASFYAKRGAFSSMDMKAYSRMRWN